MSYTIETTTVQPIVIPDVSPTSDGVMTSAMLADLETLVAGGLNMFSSAGVGAPVRPAANAVGAVPGVTAIMIWNVTSKAVQFSDGVNWYDAVGNLA